MTIDISKTPSRPVRFHREGTFYIINIFHTDTRDDIAHHAGLNPGTLRVTDALTGEILWSKPDAN